MAGQASIEEKALLTVGSQCIIEVDDVNSPSGIWLGTIRSATAHDTYLSVEAEISGGFFFDRNGLIVKTEEHAGETPTVNYSVYPYLPSILRGIRYHRTTLGELARVRQELDTTRRLHTNTIADLLRRRIVEKAKDQNAPESSLQLV